MSAEDLVREQAPKHIFAVNDTEDGIVVTIVDRVYWDEHHRVNDSLDVDFVGALGEMGLAELMEASFEDVEGRSEDELREYLEGLGFVHSPELEATAFSAAPEDDDDWDDELDDDDDDWDDLDDDEEEEDEDY